MVFLILLLATLPEVLLWHGAVQSAVGSGVVGSAESFEAFDAACGEPPAIPFQKLHSLAWPGDFVPVRKSALPRSTL